MLGPISQFVFCNLVDVWALFLGAKKRLYKRLRWSVRWLVGPSVPISLRKLVMSRLLREEEEEEENWLRRDSLAPRD
jgi:hypothetical protein